MHDKKLMHVDLKPDNILLNWEETAAGAPKLGKVIVSDLDSALDMEVRGAWSIHPTEKFRDLRFGNIRWRAPEMQTGQGIGLFSDVFTYALVYVYALIGQVPLGEDDYDELAKQAELLPEEVALGRTIEHFGPVTPEFLKHTADEKWVEALKGLQAMVVESSGEDPESRFEHWGLKDFPHLVPPLKEMLSKMLRFTPAERLTMRQAMKDPCWEKKT